MAFSAAGFGLASGGCLLVVGLLVAVVVAIYLVSLFNGLVQLKNQIEKSWANIDVLLKQRNDELPNLVSTCRGYMRHEREVLERITELRASMLGSTALGDKAAVHEQLSGALKTLFAVSENYPQLRANENFLALQKRISEIENEIADRRELYNDSVYLFNTRIHQLPDVFVASLLGMRDGEYFKVAESEKAVPKVEL